MHRSPRGIIPIALLAMLAASPARAETVGGLLRQAAAETRGHLGSDKKEREPQADKPKRSRRDRKKKTTTYLHFYGADHDGAALAAFYTVTSPYWIPSNALADDGSHLGYFQSYPHQDYEGYMLKGTPELPLGQLLSVRGSVEYDNNFRDLSRVGTKLLVEGSHRFGLDLQWNEYFENRPIGTDQISTGDINLVYRFAENEFAQFRSGLGINLLEDQVGTEIGWNFTYGFDLYPARPWIISSELDIGSIGSASVLNLRSTAGLQWQHLEVFAGGQYTQIGGQRLNGLLCGFRTWF